MEKHISGLLVVIAAVFLLVGGLVGYNIGEAETITVTNTEYQNVSVPGVTEYVTLPSQLDRAVEAFLIAVEDEEDEAGRDVDIFVDDLDDFYFDELEVRDVDEDYTVEYKGDKTIIEFSIDLRFDDGDEREKESYNVRVVFEEDEDTKVRLLA